MPKRVLKVEFEDEEEYKEIMKAIQEEAAKEDIDPNDFVIGILDHALFEEEEEAEEGEETDPEAASRKAKLKEAFERMEEEEKPLD